ncbi:hypothetical protein GGX14DRAFT_397360 [Mycena pura]|uniref:Secreted protein n=1 Tax=Mycena pura TaxID=153505 RepID=A0AAD6VCX4_9AGAR|nr:hypothetical protein GGX14DRAFT_397360 [Mycena pura]
MLVVVVELLVSLNVSGCEREFLALDEANEACAMEIVANLGETVSTDNREATVVHRASWNIRVHDPLHICSIDDLPVIQRPFHLCDSFCRNGPLSSAATLPAVEIEVVVLGLDALVAAGDRGVVDVGHAQLLLYPVPEEGIESVLRNGLGSGKRSHVHKGVILVNITWLRMHDYLDLRADHEAG